MGYFRNSKYAALGLSLFLLTQNGCSGLSSNYAASYLNDESIKKRRMQNPNS